MSSSTDGGSLSHRGILALAIPIMLSNVTTPLLGVVDTAVIGRLPGAQYVGAVALGSLVFSFVFWAFGFLRMGTTGLTAQAIGAGDDEEIRATLARSLLIAVVIGAGLMLLAGPIRSLSLHLLDASDEVESLVGRYIELRIDAAPATLMNYALLGWFVGLGKTRTGLGLQLTLNLTNMALDAVFVLVLEWGVDGVALGTAFAEWFAAGVGVLVASRHLRGRGLPRWSRIVERESLRRTLGVSFDIMVRSIALVVVFVFFSAQGASISDEVLAANAVLMHFIDTSAYFLDGLAYAAEALVGRAFGARDGATFRSAARRTTFWAAVFAACATVAFVLAGDEIIDAFTVDLETRRVARDYLYWAAFAPLAGVLAFQLDGVFIGATQGPAMRNSMLLSTALFFGAWWLLRPHGNNGLWAAFYVHYGARTLTLGAHVPGLLRRVDRPLERAALDPAVKDDPSVDPP